MPTQLLLTCKNLCRITTYRRGSYQEDAPLWTDCLSAVAVIFEEFGRWNLDWIGNMPRKLIEEKKFTIETGMRKGDLLFLTNSKGVIRHVAVALSASEVFHSSRYNRGGAIESLKTVFSRYSQIKSRRFLLWSIDPRTYLKASPWNDQPVSAYTSKLYQKFFCKNSNRKERVLRLDITQQLSNLTHHKKTTANDKYFARPIKSNIRTEQ